MGTTWEVFSLNIDHVLTGSLLFTLLLEEYLYGEDVSPG
jgi:hypothetical protein